MANFKQVIWDWNGTLLDDAQACAAAINMMLERRSLPGVTLRQYREIFDFPVRNYYLKLGFDFSKDQWDDVAVEYHKAYAITSASSPLRKGTRAALDALKAGGIGISVLSACEMRLLKRTLDERGISGYFDHIYGLDDLYAHSKLALGHAMLKNTGYSPSQTLMVGDTTHDFDVATAMGISCILMSGGHQAESKLASLGCPVVRHFTQVLGHVFDRIRTQGTT